ncbi:pyrroline-5-carboxylate reductase [Oscillospiraceae bacterium MB08-C2-2]|nr:pyrroline-5-carboxylate reductase [Oscillospiraceae bacterium MB08-C2-2]
MKQAKIGFIGAGNMAGAIIGGITGSGIMECSQVGVFDTNASVMESYQSRGFVVFDSVEELVTGCQTVFLSVKPQIFTQVLPQVKAAMTPDKLLISIAAGMTAKYIKTAIGFDCKLILAMPNTPMLVGFGASILSHQPPVTDEEFDFAVQLFASAGVAEVIPPDKMNEIIPVSGSSPAFVYEFARVIVKKAEEKGFDPQQANRLFCHTLIGAAQMMLQSDKSHEELIRMVCSPGGTTLKAMEALERCGFEQAISTAFDDCIQRAYELQELGK